MITVKVFYRAPLFFRSSTEEEIKNTCSEVLLKALSNEKYPIDFTFINVKRSGMLIEVETNSIKYNMTSVNDCVKRLKDQFFEINTTVRFSCIKEVGIIC